MTDIVVLDYYKTRVQKLNALDHIHHLDGTCKKNRLGKLCERVDKQDSSVLN